MRNKLLLCLLLLPGCVTLDAEMIRELAKDSASFCGSAGARGGAGGGGLMAGALTGGYGSGEFAFCRSNRPNTRVLLAPDGTISIEHGE